MMGKILGHVVVHVTSVQHKKVVVVGSCVVVTRQTQCEYGVAAVNGDNYDTARITDWVLMLVVSTTQKS